MGRVTAIDTPPPQDVADLAAIDALLDLHLRALRPALVVLQTPSAPAEVTLQAMAWRDDEAGRRIVPQPTSA